MTDAIPQPPTMAIPASQTGDGDPARQGSGFATAMPWILQYWRVALRWKWVIVGTIVACLIGGAIYTMLAQRIYTANARIEISRTESKVLNINGVEPERGGRVEQEFYQTQYNLLRARSQAERVAKSLNLARDPAFLAAFGGKAPPSSLRVMSKAELDQATRSVASKLGGNVVQIKPVIGSALVDISVATPNPELSAKIANSWAENFIADNLERRYDLGVLCPPLPRGSAQADQGQDGRGRARDDELCRTAGNPDHRAVGQQRPEGADRRTLDHGDRPCRAERCAQSRRHRAHRRGGRAESRDRPGDRGRRRQLQCHRHAPAQGGSAVRICQADGDLSA
ncbi:Wzz/FepE/Etk N-terminal domain-containing protein [Sphingopyxis sp. PET50]|uniref:Wzz/FepE/Etk N-terminal domain-containing protein n=1 Tax=Sphingopyxis sp. PET50 TaxID=2976533 RepID=UPI0021B0127D|nr:Wzz/FepE/Etk N-terminal domain-containing protein [Sphingopyxis sp. PET50]